MRTRTWLASWQKNDEVLWILLLYTYQTLGLIEYSPFHRHNIQGTFGGSSRGPAWKLPIQITFASSFLLPPSGMHLLCLAEQRQDLVYKTSLSQQSIFNQLLPHYSKGIWFPQLKNCELRDFTGKQAEDKKNVSIINVDRVFCFRGTESELFVFLMPFFLHV